MEYTLNLSVNGRIPINDEGSVRFKMKNAICTIAIVIYVGKYFQKLNVALSLLFMNHFFYKFGLEMKLRIGFIH